MALVGSKQYSSYQPYDFFTPAPPFGAPRGYVCLYNELKMMIPEPDLTKLPSNGFNLAETTTKAPIHIAWLSGNQSLNGYALFASHFNYLPNTIQEQEIEGKAAHLWFIEKYHNEIRDHYYRKAYFNNADQPQYDDCYYFLFEDLLVYFDIQQDEVSFIFRKTSTHKIDQLVSEIRQFRKKRFVKPEIYLVLSGPRGWIIRSFQIESLDLNLEENYNDGFPEVHQAILSRLQMDHDKGLVLLHGKPGTGKSSYIRYLVSQVKKRVIFLPPGLAESITNPDFLTILSDYPNSILVIEDAESLVSNRETRKDSPVSALLNLSDGLLSDCLNIQVICTFNTDISRVDKALVRKGRLIASYEFAELSIEKARQISAKLGHSSVINEPMTLADIYHQQSVGPLHTEQKAIIGFRKSKEVIA